MRTKIFSGLVRFGTVVSLSFLILNLGCGNTGTTDSGADALPSEVTPVEAAKSPAPAIGIEKATNGLDADNPPGPGIPEGDPVEWTYLVKNTGGVELLEIRVTDDRMGVVDCPRTSLEEGESMSCSANGTSEPGGYTNVARVTAEDSTGAQVEDTDSSNYTGGSARVAAIDIEKATNGEDADFPPGPCLEPGETVNWTYEVTNTGSVNLFDIVVEDDQGETVSCPEDELPAGESMTCTASGPAGAGAYENVATATAGYGDQGATVSDTDPSHYKGNRPPDCSEAVASVEKLWPPNHKFVSVEVLGVSDPDGDFVWITMDSIFQDEPVNGQGDGNTSPDGQGVGTSVAQVRSERSGNENGRVYHIEFTAVDACGGTCSGEVLVGVPHDKKDTAVDDGALYNSTIP